MASDRCTATAAWYWLTKTTTLIREVREETGINLGGVIPVSQHAIPEAKCLVYVLRLDNAQQASAGDGIAEVRWCPVADAQSDACYRLERALYVAHESLRRLRCTCDSRPCGSCGALFNLSPM